MTVELLVKYLEGTFYVVSLFAFLAGVYTYRQSTLNETYSELQSRYLRLLELSLERPEIGFGESRQIEQTLSPEQEYEQRQLFYIFCNIAEEAYFLRKGMTTSQWTGWDLWIKRHCAMPTLQELWFDSSSPAQGWTTEFAKDFVLYLEGILHEKQAIQRNAGSARNVPRN